MAVPGSTKLVIGASGFLGSHVVRQLVERGERVRVLIRATSSTKAFDDLDVERCYGDIFDDQAVREAMTGCDDVFYCVVDARAWLRDPAPLFARMSTACGTFSTSPPRQTCTGSYSPAASARSP